LQLFDEEIADSGDPIEEWAKRWHLNARWILLSVMYGTPEIAATGPDSVTITWDKGFARMQAAEADPVRAAVQGGLVAAIVPNPRVETLDDAIEQLRTEWKKAEEVVRAWGGVDARAFSDEHFEWLAQYRVGRETYAVIGAHAHRTVGAVKAAVTTLADFIGLPHENRRGRPVVNS